MGRVFVSCVKTVIIFTILLGAISGTETTHFHKSTRASKVERKRGKELCFWFKCGGCKTMFTLLKVASQPATLGGPSTWIRRNPFRDGLQGSGGGFSVWQNQTHFPPFFFFLFFPSNTLQDAFGAYTMQISLSPFHRVINMHRQPIFIKQHKMENNWRTFRVIGFQSAFAK